MSDEIKDFETVAPTLTFDPFEEVTTPMPETVKEVAVEDAAFNENTLTPEERQMVENFSQQIELTNSNMIMQYGAGAQKKIADFSETALDSVKSKDLGEIGNMLTNMVTELKSFDVQEEEKGFLGFFKKSANKITAMRAKYATAETNVNKISEILEGHQIQLMKDVAMLDKMYEVNKTYFKELSMYILAGKKKLLKTQNEDLPALVEKSKASGLPEDAQAANDLAAMCNRFEKKIHDLELTRMISLQMAPQIRLVQNNDILMAEKIQSSLVNTIPLWKSQMVLALGVVHSGQAAEAQRQVTDMTNELLKKNADTLKMATIETAKESERGIVDIETLKHTNESLISTFDEVLKIQAEGREKRQAAEVEMQKIESELKQKLLEIKK
ncbi:toxic anion resistance protein [Eubacterium sp. 1001713B170207_170306_E7]|uniref:toxic anion resistance protein n=1 Tax=Eubacterium sp. 1001713B170207_170306_E7 TaxID=2787097 RepID=UPI0018977FD5|nr:toxic anion resistance protein [Eubacterium sp. 1001713B170207_170306_E7]